VQAILDSARADGLPTEPLVQKALEGHTKGAEPARIVAAVRTLRANLASARDALGGDADAEELAAAAASLRVGASPRALGELRALRRGRSLVVPLGVLTDMVAHGVPMASAWQSVERLARAGSEDAAYLALRERVERRGGSPLPSATAGRPPGQPAPVVPAAPARTGDGTAQRP
jgi:hypothetical protein